MTRRLSEGRLSDCLMSAVLFLTNALSALIVMSTELKESLNLILYSMDNTVFLIYSILKQLQKPK